MSDTARLRELAKLVRYYILRMTTKAASGHPTSSLCATDMMVALFFEHFRSDLDNLQNANNDKVIFSKGHVSPLIYALYATAGVIEEKDLETYRQFGSVLEGHPTMRFKFAEAATGSLGQGLSIGVGEALALRSRISNSKKKPKLPKVYVLMGDSEMAEGSVWEAMEIAGYYELSNLVGIVDVNRLGQSRKTMLEWDLETYAERSEAFGWETKIIDGHDFEQINKAFGSTSAKKPTLLIAKTVKGKGVSFLENKEGWHGKALAKEDFDKAVRELGEVDRLLRGKIKRPISKFQFLTSNKKEHKKEIKVDYKVGEEVATRKAFGEALAKLGDVNPKIISLDGETSNSTFSEIFAAKHPDRYFEMFIAEQNMVGVALGFSKLGFVPFASTFAAFFTRAFDQIRMAAYSGGNLKFVGSHSGVSIGEDGPSQMGLEDIAMFRSVLGSTVLVPGDAVACQKLVQLASETEGIFYIRTNRPATPVMYSDVEEFKLGGCKIVRSGKNDQLTIVACGVVLAEAVKAAEVLSKEKINVRVIDAYSVKPIDEETIKKSAYETNNLVITVEDHYFEGGLGDAVLNVFAKQGNVKVVKMAVSKMPMSGKGNELLKYEGIDAEGIISKVKDLQS